MDVPCRAGQPPLHPQTALVVSNHAHMPKQCSRPIFSMMLCQPPRPLHPCHHTVPCSECCATPTLHTPPLPPHPPAGAHIRACMHTADAGACALTVLRLGTATPPQAAHRTQWCAHPTATHNHASHNHTGHNHIEPSGAPTPLLPMPEPTLHTPPNRHARASLNFHWA